MIIYNVKFDKLDVEWWLSQDEDEPYLWLGESDFLGEMIEAKSLKELKKEIRKFSKELFKHLKETNELDGFLLSKEEFLSERAELAKYDC